MQHLQPNSTLQGGKYRIERVLGQGGFGITYLALQSGLERKVAVKEFFMKELCERDESTSHVTLGSEGSRETVNRFREKFLKEARNIARLNHPNIVRIIDVFEENGTAYYVMEYAENGSLIDKVKREGYLSEPVATRYILQVAEALDYIHQQKMNHLDVKPANIMLNEKDETVLIDFGLSKQYDVTTGSQTSTTPVGISEGYAPMEQYKQGGVGEFSPETDIYALGATYFKLLTGVTPPSASDVNEDGVPVVELKAKGISPKAIAVICKAMEGRKKDRMKSVGSFINGLKTIDNTNSHALQKADDEATVLTPDMQRDEDERKRKEAEIKAAKERAEAEARAKVEAERLSCEEDSNKQRNIVYIFALLVGCILVAVFLLMPRQDSREPKRLLNTLEDSLAYCIGYSQTQGFYAYANDKYGVDTTRIDDIVEGLETGFWGGDHRKNNLDEDREKAYNFGMEIGKQMSEQMLKGLNYEIYGEDSTRAISSELYIAGFIAGVKQDCNIMNIEKALVIAQQKMREVKSKVLEIKYADNKKECEEFMKKIAHQSGIRALDSGVYYEVITQGNGEIPCDTSRVVVHYEGKLINGHVFDSSYSRGEPTIFQCNQVIPGWADVLTHMPVGSKWRVYIPQEQAYEEREAGDIKPFSCLQFEIELLGIKSK